MASFDHMIDLAISLPIAFFGIWAAIIIVNAVADSFKG